MSPSLSQSPPLSLKQKPLPKLNWVRASDVETKEVKFLWYPYVPLGAMTLLFGEGGIGKSWITCAIAADLSTGRPLPGLEGPQPPRRILMVSAEDDLEKVVAPRLLSMGADMDNIALINESFVLDNDHASSLRNAMKDFSATVLFLDPLVSYMGGTLDIHKANETREFMDRLNRIAKQEDNAVLIVHHTRKMKDEGSYMDRALGSVDIGNAIRSALYVSYSKTGQKVIRHAKQNWSPPGPELAFQHTGDSFAWVPVEAVAPKVSMVSTQRRTSVVVEFLKEFLAAGPKPAQEVIAEAKLRGFNERLLNRGKVGIASSRRVKDVWFWELVPPPEGPLVETLTPVARVVGVPSIGDTPTHSPSNPPPGPITQSGLPISTKVSSPMLSKTIEEVPTSDEDEEEAFFAMVAAARARASNG